MKRRMLVLSLLLTAALVGCSKSRSNRLTVPPQAAGILTVENFEPAPIQVYVDYQFVGTVDGFATDSFLVDPGQYTLSIDELGDGLGIFDYTTVILGSDQETIVTYDDDLFDIVIDIIISF